MQEFFGGDIIAYPNPESDKKGHYFNRIDGIDLDLTFDQFKKKLNYSSKSKIGNFGKYSFSCVKRIYGCYKGYEKYIRGTKVLIWGTNFSIGVRIVLKWLP